MGGTPNLQGEFLGETHKVIKHTQTYPLRNQRQKSPICLCVVGEVTESQPRAERAALFSLPLPNRQHHNSAQWVALPWQIPKALPFTP